MARFGKDSWVPITVSLLIGAGVFAMVYALRAAGLLESLELQIYDHLVAAQPADNSMARHVVVVGFDQSDYHDRYAKDGSVTPARFSYPMADDEMAALLNRLLEHHPRAIGVDIFRDIPVPNIKGTGPGTGEHSPQREQLREVWTHHSNVIFGAKIDKGGAPSDLKPQQIGMADFETDPDGTVRRGWVRVPAGWPLSFRLVFKYLAGEKPPVRLGAAKEGSDRDIQLGKTTFRALPATFGAYRQLDQRFSQFLYDYRSRINAFPHLTATQVIDGHFDPTLIQDSIVIVGVTDPNIKDFLATPLEQNTLGCELHAVAAEQLLRAALKGISLTRVWSPQREGLWIFLWSLCGAALGLAVRSPWRFVLAAAIGIVALFFAVTYAFGKGLWIPFLPPAMAWLLSAGLVASYISYHEKNDRQAMMRLFSRHVSKGVAEELWSERGEFIKRGRLRAQPLIATVLFSDLKGFSGVAEQLPPADLMDWLNDFMDGMSRIVEQNGGIINKYMGDSIMAVFGVPVPRKSDAEHRQDACDAVQCALGMRRRLGELKEQWKAQHRPAVDMRIGIFTGPLVAGSLGSAERAEYTVIGDTVNIASRLESFDKQMMDADIAAAGCRILVGQSTNDLISDRFQTRFIGLTSLPGKEQKVHVHGVIGPMPIAPPPTEPAGAEPDAARMSAARA